MSEPGASEQSARVIVPLALSRASVRQRLSGKTLTRIGGATMGTGWSVVCVLPASISESAIRATVERELARIIAEMSNWEEGSHISRFNRASPDSRHRVPQDFAKVLSCALRLAEETGGAYDPTIGALVDLWGFGPRGPRNTLPEPAAIASRHARCGWQRLSFDVNARIITQPGGLSLDFSSIAKGYAVDCVAASLDGLGIAHHLVEIGGELKGRGVKPDGSPWWVGIDIPSLSDRILVALHGLSIATSGSERAFSHAGKIYAHTIDPRSGYAVSNGVLAVTVLHADCMVADAYATALMVLGREEGLAFATAKTLAALFMHEDGESMTPALAAMLD